ncbi:Elicitin [Globisporangium polare]
MASSSPHRCRLLVLLFLTVLVLTSATTSKPTPTPSPVVVEAAAVVATPAPVVGDTTAPVVTATTTGSAASATAAADPTATVGPSPVPIHSAQVNSNTFRVTDNLVCPDLVADRINTVYSKNKKMFIACMNKSGYQIFPYSGKVPTAQDTTLLVQTPECMGVITAVALSNLPACSLGDMPVKAVVETLLKISVDMADGAPAPSAEEFHALMAWRRDVNAAQAAGLPYDSDSELYAIFKKALWRALANTTVKVLADLTIVYDGAPAQTFANTSGSSLSDTAASVHASSVSSSGTGVVKVASITTPAASNSTSKSSSAAVRPTAASSGLLAVVVTLAAALLTVT